MLVAANFGDFGWSQNGSQYSCFAKDGFAESLPRTGMFLPKISKDAAWHRFGEKPTVFEGFSSIYFLVKIK